MKPAKNPEMVDRMFAQGQPSLTDPASGYRYSLTARCPKDGYYSPVGQVEREHQELSRVVFTCPSCFWSFEAPREQLYIV